jgi:hypothetical protein
LYLADPVPMLCGRVSHDTPHRSVLVFIVRNGGRGWRYTLSLMKPGPMLATRLRQWQGSSLMTRVSINFGALWRKRTVDLSEPFHTIDCFHGFKQFEGWPQPQRFLLMYDLADIIIQTAPLA